MYTFLNQFAYFIDIVEYYKTFVMRAELTSIVCVQVHLPSLIGSKKRCSWTYCDRFSNFERCCPFSSTFHAWPIIYRSSVMSQSVSKLTWIASWFEEWSGSVGGWFCFSHRFFCNFLFLPRKHFFPAFLKKFWRCKNWSSVSERSLLFERCHHWDVRARDEYQ